MKPQLRILGVLLILGSPFCFWRFQTEMAVVKLAKADSMKASAVGGFSTNPQAVNEAQSAEAREADHRASARNWFLGGAGGIVVGLGLVGYSLLGRRSAVSSST